MSARRRDEPATVGIRGEKQYEPDQRILVLQEPRCSRLLANLPGAEQRDLIGCVALPRRGPNSITSKKALRIELEHVLDEGMALSDEELRASLISIVVPIRDECRGVAAAINLAADASMISLEEMVDGLLPHLLVTAGNISARLGYRREDETAR